MNVKKCKDNEVYNPKTKRCVSANGAIGKKILAGKNVAVKGKKMAKEPKTCKDDEIVNPATGRCVKRTSKLGQKLLLLEAVNPPDVCFEQTAYLRKGNKEIVVYVYGSLAGEKKLLAGGKQKKYDTLQKLEEDYEAVMKKYMDAGYEVVSTLGDKVEKLEDIIKNILTCKKNKDEQRKLHPKVDVKTCTNDTTLIMMEPLTHVSKKKLVKLADGFCFDVDELVGFLFSTRKPNNPLNAGSIPLSELYRILAHPSLDEETKSNLRKLILEVEAKNIAIFNLYEKDVARFKAFFKVLMGAALVCTSDYTPDFAPSQKILAKLSAEIAKFDEGDIQLIMNLTSKRNNNLASIMNNYANTCIHGVGYKLSDVVFHQYSILSKLGIDVQDCVPPYVFTLNEDSSKFALIYSISDSDSHPSLNYYDHTLDGAQGDTVRLGNVSGNSLDTSGAWGFYDREKAKAIFADIKDKLDMKKVITQKKMKKLSDELSD